jgi:branched-chain amino acid transport system permease protein
VAPVRYLAVAFAMSAVYGGVAGSMLMINRPFASDAQFGIHEAIFLVVGLVIGGTGAIAGAIPGAFVYFFVPFYVSQWVGAAYATLFFGITLLVLLFVLPGGVIDGVRRVRAQVVQVEPRPRWLREL